MSFHGRAECIDCCGDCELERTGESCYAFANRIERTIARHYEAARLCLEFLRRDRADYNEAPADSHVYTFADVPCVQALVRRVRELRATIADLRASRRRQPYERLALCVACRGTGLAEHACEGCGEPVDLGTGDWDALEKVDILVHDTCDALDHEYFARHPRRGQGDASVYSLHADDFRVGECPALGWA